MSLLAFLAAVDRILHAFRAATVSGRLLEMAPLTIGGHDIGLPKCVLREFPAARAAVVDNELWFDATAVLRDSSFWPGLLHLCTGSVFAWSPDAPPGPARSHETLACIDAICPRLAARLDKVTFGVHDIFGYSLDTAPTRAAVSRVFGVSADDDDVALVYLCLLTAALLDSSTSRSPEVDVTLVSGKCTYPDGTQGFLSDLRY